jgi:peptidoglycan/LPS O-acetylase OafA/YrhL
MGRNLKTSIPIAVYEGPNIRQKSDRIEELESIRGLAALLVVFFHIPKWNSFLNIGIIDNGYLMVDVFFVLSGFVIFSAYADRLNSGRDLARFQFLRFGRLYPTHLIFLLVFSLIEVGKYIATRKLGVQSVRVVPFSENGPIAFVQQLLLLQSIGPTGNALSFNGPAWSISVEFYTYLIFGILAILFKSGKEYAFFLVAFASITLLANRNTYGCEDLLRCLCGFFFGCLTASGIKSSKLRLPTYAPDFIFVSIILFLQCKSSNEYDVAIYFLTAALIVSILLSENGVLKNILRLRVLVWLGLISYSVYMSHTFVLWVTSNLFKRVLKRPELMSPDGKWVLQLSTGEAFGAFLIFAFLVVLVGWISYSWIEKPMREKSRRFASVKLN